MSHLKQELSPLSANKRTKTSPEAKVSNIGTYESLNRISELSSDQGDASQKFRNSQQTLQDFALNQMSLSKHMKEVKSQLKREFIETQLKKKLRKNKKAPFSQSFQHKLDKAKALDDLLGLKETKPKKIAQKQLIKNSDFDRPISIITKSTEKKRKLSLSSDVKSPETARILADYRVKPLFSPKSTQYQKIDSVISAGFRNTTLNSLDLHQKEVKSNFDKIKQERVKSYNAIVKNIESRQKTFSKFGFKTDETDECHYLRPILDIFWGNEPKGTMMVVDLWGTKNMRKYLDSCKLTKDKLILSKIASVRQNKSDFLKDSKKLFSNLSQNTEETNNLKNSLKIQQLKIFNHFKKFGGVNFHLYENNGIVKKITPNSIQEILAKPNKETTPGLLKDVFINAFPGIYCKNKLNDLCSCNTEETKTGTEEKSIYSISNPFFKTFRERLLKIQILKEILLIFLDIAQKVIMMLLRP